MMTHTSFRALILSSIELQNDRSNLWQSVLVALTRGPELPLLDYAARLGKINLGKNVQSVFIPAVYERPVNSVFVYDNMNKLRVGHKTTYVIGSESHTVKIRMYEVQPTVYQLDPSKSWLTQAYDVLGKACTWADDMDGNFLLKVGESESTTYHIKSGGVQWTS